MVLGYCRPYHTGAPCRYLQRWWAQYLESLGEMEAAKNYYSAAKDYLSVVRLLCYLGDTDQVRQRL